MKKNIYLQVLSIVAILSLLIPQGSIRANTLLAPTVFDCTAVTEIPQSECQALVTFYNATHGGAWSNSTNWLQTNTPSDWFGLSVTAGHVTGLVLNNNHLYGTIPPELGNLANLTTLDLDDNQLDGSIPTELGNLTSLTSLFLQKNTLSGAIPPELTKLVNLEFLALDYNGLIALDSTLKAFLTTKEPDWELTQAIAPTDLHAHGSTLFWTPILYKGGWGWYEISYATEQNGPYHVLAYTTNKLTDIYHITELPVGNYFFRLQTISYNTARWIRSEYTGSEAVSIPDLEIIKTAPEWAVPGSEITYTLKINNFSATPMANVLITDTIPVGANYVRGGSKNGQNIEWAVPSLAAAGSLEVQFVVTATQTITNSQFAATASEGYSARGDAVVTTVANTYCELVTEIPITECQALEAFYLAVHTPLGKWFQSLTPSKWEGVTVTQGHVKDLSLPFKSLKGSLPPEIGDLQYLMRLDLGYNDLSGSIPPELGNLSSLKILVLHNNILSGDIPTELGKLVNLIYLKLGYNLLSTSDPALRAFLNAKDPGWDATQTIAPTNLYAVGNTLYWTPILYTGGSGSYEISYAAAPDGPYQVLNKYVNKSAQMYRITELPGGKYFFRLRTTGFYQMREVWSDYTTPVAATLPMLEILKTAPEWAMPGSQITYTLKVSNLSTITMNNVVITDTIPVGATYVRGGSKNGQVVKWAVPSLPASSTLNVQFVVTATQTLTNSQFAVTGSGGYSATGDAVITKVANSFCKLVTEIPITECQALEAFYLAIHTPLGNWLQTFTPSSWEGVTVTQGHVTDLQLPFKGLNGSLPPEIGNLQYLTRLDLGYNDLIGSIPPELGNLTSLKILVLHNNTLSGDIPTEFGKLVNLEYLRLGYNLLFASDPALLAFLNAKEPGWDTTQTIAPTNLHVEGNTLSWTPILYTYGFGYYEISYASALNGPYQFLAYTVNKSAQTYQINSLPGGSYFFRLRTYSGGNSWSDYSLPLAATLPALEITKTAPEWMTANDEITYTLKISNVSVFTVTNVLITDTIPMSANYVRGGSKNGQVVEWTVPFLPPSGSLEVQFVVTATQTVTNSKYAVTDSNGHFAAGAAVVTKVANTFCELVTEIPFSECQALEAFYLAVNTSLFNWLQTLTPSSWDGITVTQGHVTDLSLPFRGLSGSLPPAISNLHYLMRLDLGYNNLSGTIPSELGNIASLKFLVLHVNALRGDIPTEFGKLANLEYLKLGYNLLTVSDPALRAFLNAKEPGWDTTQTVAPANVHAQRNTLFWTPILYTNDDGYYEISYAAAPGGPYQVLANTPDKLTQMYRITELPSGNYFFRLRTNVLKFSYPNVLSFWSDYTTPVAVTIPVLDIIKTAPQWAAAGSEMTYTLKVSNFSTIPVTNMLITDTIPMGANYVRGGGKNGQVIEWAVPSMQASSTLDVQFVVTATQTITNSKYGVSAAGGFSAAGKPVVTIKVNSFCAKVTEIPLNECDALTAIYTTTNGPQWSATKNWMQTYTPSNWNGVNIINHHVIGLDLSHRHIKGVLPPEISYLADLTWLDLGYNNFSGSIPPQLGDLTNLIFLTLNASHFSGSIPPELGNLTNLRILNLSNNALSGTIPVELSYLVNLTGFDLGHNRLSTSDPKLIAFLNAKNSMWVNTQTIAPIELGVKFATTDIVGLTWTPIAYTADGGYYQVYSSTLPGGPFNLVGVTASKLESAFTIEHLNPAVSYYFRLRTYTPAFGYQQNELWSDFSEVISATTAKDQILLPVILR